MDKDIKWTPNYGFAMLSMMDEFTDAELKEFGMDDATIKKYREYLAQEAN